MARGSSVAPYMGHEKEPPAKHSGHSKNGRPLVHSHSSRPKRGIKGAGKVGNKRSR